MDTANSTDFLTMGRSQASRFAPVRPADVGTLIGSVEDLGHSWSLDRARTADVESGTVLMIVKSSRVHRLDYQLRALGWSSHDGSVTPSGDLHKCQPVMGLDGDSWDHQFSRTRDLATTNPWCWSSALGFHRRRDPQIRIAVGGPRGSSAFVGPTFMQGKQAWRLGVGLGTSQMPSSGLSSFLERWVEVDYLARNLTDIEVFARFGQVCASVSDDAIESSARRHRVLSDAVAFFAGDTRLRAHSRQMLQRALAGDSPLNNEGIKRKSRDAYESGLWSRDAEALLDYTMPYVLGALLDIDSHAFGIPRQVVRMFSTTKPTSGRVGEWISLISESVQRNLR